MAEYSNLKIMITYKAKALKKYYMHHSYTQEEKDNIKGWIIASLKLIVRHDADLLSPELIQTNLQLLNHPEYNRELHEITLNGRLFLYMNYLLMDFGYSDYYVDIEYNRYLNNKKMVRSLQSGEDIEIRPDIVVHKRTRLEEPLPHLLIIEAKKYKNNQKDRNTIMSIMRDLNYKYKFGLLVSYYESIVTINCKLYCLEEGIFNIESFQVEK